MQVGLIAITKRHREVDPSLVSIRDFFQPSPLFRYSVAFCEQYYDEVFVLAKGSRKILHLDNDVSDIDFRMDDMDGREKKKWLREVSNYFRQYAHLGAEVNIFAPSWYRRLADWLEPDYECQFPMREMSIGKQLHFLKQSVGEITYKK